MLELDTSSILKYIDRENLSEEEFKFFTDRQSFY